MRLNTQITIAMKNVCLIVLGVFISAVSIHAQQLTANFSTDNCYAVYLGDENMVNNKILPSGSANAVINTQSSMIFNATTVTTTYSPGQWFYVITWSDDSRCQGLIGEFSGAQTIKTGDSGWEVYATGRNANSLADAPNSNEINSYVAQANNSGSWTNPAVGEINIHTSQVCRWYSKVDKVKGISDDAKWVWHDTGNHNHAQAPFAGYNHDEFLIFRFPVKLIDESGPDDCCRKMIDVLDEIRDELQGIKDAINNQ